MPHDFPDMSDQPTNTGYSERDWDEIRNHIPCEQDDWEDDEEIETPRESTVTVVNRNDGAMTFQNE